MKDEDEVQAWLAEHMPDGPGSDRQEGIQAALDWVTGLSPVLELE
jgi:hypothetical protein